MVVRGRLLDWPGFLFRVEGPAREKVLHVLVLFGLYLLAGVDARIIL